MSNPQFEHSCDEENAPKFALWIRARGGVAVWPSVDLGDPGASWSTPVRQPDGEPTTKPTWKAANKPKSIHLDPDRIGVYVPGVFKELPVTLKRNGMTLYLTDASQRKVDKAMDRCRKQHGDAWYRKGGPFERLVYICYHASEISLTEWLKLHPCAGLALLDIDHGYLPNVGLLGLSL